MNRLVWTCCSLLVDCCGHFWQAGVVTVVCHRCQTNCYSFVVTFNGLTETPIGVLSQIAVDKM